MKEDHLSVRKLAAEADVSPTIIQNLKSGKKLISPSRLYPEF
jgi:hypothetical protein